MTYGLGILVQEGLLLASDSRSSAGLDNVAEVSKLAVIARPGDRVVAIQSAGNLATTQEVVRELREAVGSGDKAADLALAPTMADVASLVGGKLESWRHPTLTERIAPGAPERSANRSWYQITAFVRSFTPILR